MHGLSKLARDHPSGAGPLPKTKRRLINFMILIVWKFGGEEAEVMKSNKMYFPVETTAMQFQRPQANSIAEME